MLGNRLRWCAAGRGDLFAVDEPTLVSRGPMVRERELLMFLGQTKNRVFFFHIARQQNISISKTSAIHNIVELN